MSEFKELFDASVEAGLDKNGILMALITDGGLDVAAAVREYNQLARDAGMVMTTEQKKAKIAEVLSEVSLDTKDDVEQAKADLMDALDVAPTTAMSYIKDFAKENDIALPIAQRVIKATKEQVVAFLLENEGETKAKLSKGLQDEFDYSKGTADTITSHLGYMTEYASQVNG